MPRGTVPHAAGNELARTAGESDDGGKRRGAGRPPAGAPTGLQRDRSRRLLAGLTILPMGVGLAAAARRRGGQGVATRPRCGTVSGRGVVQEGRFFR